VEDHPSDELHVEMALAQGPPGGFPDHGKGLRQKIIQGLSPGEALAELRGLGLQLGVGQLQDLGSSWLMAWTRASGD
jgi:hypothetical protein